MRKSVFLLSLVALLTSVEGAAQATIPQVSTDDATYTYYIVNASKASYYLSNTVKEQSVIVLTSSTAESNWQAVKLLATDGGYAIYTADDNYVLGTSGTGSGSMVNYYAAGTTGIYTDWNIAEGVYSGSLSGYKPFYTITPSSNSNVGWNQFGGSTSTEVGLWGDLSTSDNSQWNFIPANYTTFVKTITTIEESLGASAIPFAGFSYTGDALTTLNTALTTAKAVSSESYQLSDATTLLSAYQTFYQSEKGYIYDASALTSGYYEIISETTSDSDRYRYMFNDDLYTSNTKKYTLYSSTEVTTNNGVWYLTFDTNANTFTVLNGQGTGIKLGTTEYTSITYDTSTAANGYFYFSSPTVHCSNWGYSCGSYHYAISYDGGSSSTNNRWMFQKVDISDATVYTAQISGLDDGYVTYTNNGVTENAYDGGFFLCSSTPTVSDFTATVEGYDSKVAIDGTTVQVTYASKAELYEELVALRTQAETIRDTRGVGYPMTTSEAYTTFTAAIETAAAVTDAATFADLSALEEAITTYKSTKTDIQMPEDGKAYTFTAVLKDGRKQLMYYDAANGKFDVITSTLLSDIEDVTVYNASSFGDNAITIASGTATNSQSGQGIEKSFDGDVSTVWHCSWWNTTSPLTITYTFEAASHVDYFIYTPTSSGSNGRFGEITVSYATSSAPTTFIEYGSADFNESGSVSVFSFGDSGIDDVLTVKIVINSAASDQSQYFFGSCAEIAFYDINDDKSTEIDTYFTSSTCEALKDNVTARQAAQIKSPLLRMLAKKLLSGDYSEEFRVADFDCYETRTTVQSRLKTSNAYDPYENPTGIYFTEGDTIVVFADSISDDYPVSLCIKNFSNASLISSEGQPESSYPLTNGANVIVPSNRGNGYVSYYSDEYEKAPTVRLHFAMANEVGYFDATKNMTNADWKRYLANAETVGADIIDFVTQRMHVAVPYANAIASCPTNAEKLALIYDSLVYREREIMGLGLEGNTEEPKNHQFARPVSSSMFADATGAAAAFGSFNQWCNPDDFGFWGLGHELGHNNQITPGFKWSGCGETTNNIYAAWVEHKLGATNAYGTGYHRLEDEVTGVGTYASTRGGRFEAYLEEGVRNGVSWQLQDGPDYNGTEPSSISVVGADENGSTGETVTTTSRNYDHFVKVVPFWQLELYTIEAGANPRAFGDFIQTYRDGFDTSTYNTNGKMQMEMVRRFCDAAKINFLDFFETAGILKPINAYIEDYSAGWNIITETMCTEVKEDIEAKNYPEAPAGLNFINAYNWKIFRDKTTLDTSVAIGTDCDASTTDRIRITNASWPGAVAYKTYDASGNLLHISMYGLGDSQMSSTYTYVLFPSSESPSYITAVGYDGSEVTCYQATSSSAPAKSQPTK